MLIDRQLQEVGWEADTENLRYSKGTRPEKGRNLAIAEWPTDSTVSRNGYVDYALFVGLKLVGVIEAKKNHIDISSVIDYQCRDYAKLIKEEHREYVIKEFGEYKVPFLFATNGKPYLKQLETKSGIWFLDARDPANIPKARSGWPSPSGLEEELQMDIIEATHKLETTGYELLTRKEGLGLREYQVEAIQAAEKAINEGATSVLLSMATGTGKTRTILGMIYRFLQAKRFRRILFLVDRTSLGDQALDTFKEVRIEELMTLDQLYDIKELTEKDFDKDTRVQVATVQSLVKRIMYNDSYTKLSVTDYDLIIIDEAHRGYIFDKELSEAEFLYRNQEDFKSKYRSVIEYFDAVKIALTATPALHTTEIFGKPVFTYSYRDAVIDGYLVDHDAPHILKTKLSTEGIKFKPGEEVPIYDPITGVITNVANLQDELDFEVENFNRQVITENFNRVVLEEIARELDPDGNSKTLIFAVDDAHADLIVKILKEIYEQYGVDNEAIMKITGSVGGGNKKKVAEAIKRFKNENYPNIVVTVDLLTTGIDVPEIDTLVFMRRIKSRILFEQMLGRATRLCPKNNKDHFEIYDAVGVYEALDPVNTMKPIVANPKAEFETLIEGFDVLETELQKQNQIDMIVAKLQRKKRNIGKDAMEQFTDLTGGKTPEEFIEHVNELTVEDATKYIQNCKGAFAALRGPYAPGKPKVVSFKEDELVSHVRGYGNAIKPEDYLEEFKEFITTHLNDIAALNIVCTRPKELTRAELKSLRLELDRNNFTEKQLNTAIKEMTNEEITADIISIIRQQALGDALISHEEKIKTAMVRLKLMHPELNKIQLKWLERIEKYLLKENILNKETFETEAFKMQGGFKKMNQIFTNKLDDYIDEINEYLYENKMA